MATKSAGILTGGGDAPGLNSTITPVASHCIQQIDGGAGRPGAARPQVINVCQ